MKTRYVLVLALLAIGLAALIRASAIKAAYPERPFFTNWYLQSEK